MPKSPCCYHTKLWESREGIGQSGFTNTPLENFVFGCLDFYPVSGPCILGPRVSLLQWFLRKIITVVWFHVKAQPQKPALNLKCSLICHGSCFSLQPPLPPCRAVSAPHSFWLTLCLFFLLINFSFVYICVWYTYMYVCRYTCVLVHMEVLG